MGSEMCIRDSIVINVIISIWKVSKECGRGLADSTLCMAVTYIEGKETSNAQNETEVFGAISGALQAA